jgi:hypothetical protein
MRAAALRCACASGRQVHIRPHEAPLDRPIKEPYVQTVVDRRYEISAGAHLPTLRPQHPGDIPSTFTYDPTASPEVLFRVEESRGYDARGTL